MQSRTRIIWGITVTLAGASLFAWGVHLNKPRVIGRAVAPDGTEMCIVQQFNWSPEPFTTSFVFRKPGAPWGRFYYDHEDTYWNRSLALLDTNAQEAVFYRRGSRAVTFSWSSETFTLHRFNRTLKEPQWEMPAAWSPDKPVY